MPLPGSGAGVYQNPLRGITNLNPERVDQGVDFSGSGPIYPIGNAVIKQTKNPGWPGGTFIAYQLTDGAYAGRYVYVAEDVMPVVSVGQHVTPDTVIGEMYQGPSGIETGWAAPPPDVGAALAGVMHQWGNYNPSDRSTWYGVSFNSFLTSLGVPGGTVNGPVFGSGQSGFPTGSGGSGGGTSGSGGSSKCLVSVPILGCALSASGARALVGGLLIAPAIGVGLVGAIILAAFSFRGTKAGAAVSRSASTAGNAISAVPGFGSAGSAIASAGA